RADGGRRRGEHRRRRHVGQAGRAAQGGEGELALDVVGVRPDARRAVRHEDAKRSVQDGAGEVTTTKDTKVSQRRQPQGSRQGPGPGLPLPLFFVKSWCPLCLCGDGFQAVTRSRAVALRPRMASTRSLTSRTVASKSV